MEVRELLPIGSVIWLKDAKVPFMITGVKQMEKETGKGYDYIGVLYPEGYIGSQRQFLFQHADIDSVLFEGYKDEAREKFIEKLSEFYHEG